MKMLSKVVVAGLTVLGLVSAGTPASAQQARMAVAAHKGTFNYLRDAPDRSSHIIEKMRQGTRFEVVGLQRDYYAVILADGTRGWTYITNVRFL